MWYTLAKQANITKRALHPGFGVINHCGKELRLESAFSLLARQVFLPGKAGKKKVARKDTDGINEKSTEGNIQHDVCPDNDDA